MREGVRVFYVRGIDRKHRKGFVACLMILSVLWLSLMLQVYFGLFPAGFSVYVEMKSVFLARVILERLSLS